MKKFHVFSLLLLLSICLLLSGCITQNTGPKLSHDGRWFSEELHIYISFEWDDYELAQQDPSIYYSYFIDQETNEQIRCDFVHHPPNTEVRIVCTEFDHEKYHEGDVFFEGELEAVEEQCFTVREKSTGTVYTFVSTKQTPTDRQGITQTETVVSQMMKDPGDLPQFTKAEFIAITDRYLAEDTWELPPEKCAFHTYGITYSNYIIEDVYLFTMYMEPQSKELKVTLERYADGVVVDSETDPLLFEQFLKQ